MSQESIWEQKTCEGFVLLRFLFLSAVLALGWGFNSGRCSEIQTGFLMGSWASRGQQVTIEHKTNGNGGKLQCCCLRGSSTLTRVAGSASRVGT